MTLQRENTAFVFPGQGSQRLGMGKLLAQAEPSAARIFIEAEHTLDLPLRRICWDGPPETLNDTEFTQPALLAHSMAVLQVFQERFPGFVPAFAAGHSLGEISALAAAESLSLADALRLVRERGKAMKQAGLMNPGGMTAILGLERSAVEDACQRAERQTGRAVVLANDNCPGQIVISGHEEALELAADLLKQAGARKVIRLAVSIASHSPLMEPARDDFNTVLQQTEFRNPIFPVVGNVSAEPLLEAAEARKDLSAQLTSAVQWTESVQAMVKHGIDTFVEIGPGSVLSGLIRRISPQARTIALDEPPSFAALNS